MKKSLRQGVTLIELMIAISMFCIVMVIAVDAFMTILRASRDASLKQNIQDHAEFVFTVMSKELRTAKINYGDTNDQNCANLFFNNRGAGEKIPNNQIYGLADSAKELRIRNADGDCVRYFVANDPANNNIPRLKVERYSFSQGGITKEAWVTPNNIKVMDLNFETTDLQSRDIQGNPLPASVAYYLRLESVIWNPPTVEYFNFINARNQEQL